MLSVRALQKPFSFWTLLFDLTLLKLDRINSCWGYVMKTTQTIKSQSKQFKWKYHLRISTQQNGLLRKSKSFYRFNRCSPSHRRAKNSCSFKNGYGKWNEKQTQHSICKCKCSKNTQSKVNISRKMMNGKNEHRFQCRTFGVRRNNTLVLSFIYSNFVRNMKQQTNKQNLHQNK